MRVSWLPKRRCGAYLPDGVAKVGKGRGDSHRGVEKYSHRVCVLVDLLLVSFKIRNNYKVDWRYWTNLSKNI